MCPFNGINFEQIMTVFQPLPPLLHLLRSTNDSLRHDTFFVIATSPH